MTFGLVHTSTSTQDFFLLRKTQGHCLRFEMRSASFALSKENLDV